MFIKNLRMIGRLLRFARNDGVLRNRDDVRRTNPKQLLINCTFIASEAKQSAPQLEFNKLRQS